MIIVTGQPRSGTSLMMRILYESGLQCISDDMLSFESKLASTGNAGFDWTIGYDDTYCLKVLHPTVGHVPIANRFIWMTRNSRDQAKSQRHFLGNRPRQWIAPASKAIHQMNIGVPRLMRRCGSDVLTVDFGKLVTAPHSIVDQLSAWVGANLLLDSIIRRSPAYSGKPVGELEKVAYERSIIRFPGPSGTCRGEASRTPPTAHCTMPDRGVSSPLPTPAVEDAR